MSPATRLHVAPTFDFDAISSVLAEEPEPVWLSWAEFGVRVGAPRLLDFLRDRDWQVTWFVPGQTIEAFPAICQRIHAEGHEIAHHGYCHEAPSLLDEGAERAMLERGIQVITDLTGMAPRGYRAPFWKSSERTQQLLIEYGFSYDASLMSGDFLPYWYRAGDVFGDEPPYVRFGMESELVEVPVAWHLEDGSLYEIASAGGGPLKPPKEVADIWDEDFQFAYEQIPGGLLTLTMHPEITGRGGRLRSLSKLMDGWTTQGGVEIVRVDHFVESWRAANPSESGAVEH